MLEIKRRAQLATRNENLALENCKKSPTTHFTETPIFALRIQQNLTTSF